MPKNSLMSPAFWLATDICKPIGNFASSCMSYCVLPIWNNKTCGFVGTVIEVDVSKTVANGVCLQRSESHGNSLCRRMNLQVHFFGQYLTYEAIRASRVNECWQCSSTDGDIHRRLWQTVWTCICDEANDKWEYCSRCTSIVVRHTFPKCPFFPQLLHTELRSGQFLLLWMESPQK